MSRQLSWLLMIGLVLNCVSSSYCQNPGASAAYSEGVRLYDAKRFRQSIPYFDRAIRLNPRHVHAYYRRGVAYAQIGQHQHALQDFNVIVHLKPDQSKPHIDRGVEYMM
jgi:tetratricopeptide (TPR) repeat protein